jgi:phage gp45-like
MQNLKSMLKNMITRAIITLINEDKTFQISLFEKVKNVQNTNLYGLKTFAINGSSVILFNINGNTDNTMGFALNIANDLPKLLEGETMLYNLKTKNYVYLKNDGEINIKCTKAVITADNVDLAGGTKGVARLDDTVSGQVIIPSGSSAGTYNLTSGKIASSSSKVVAG